MPAIDSLIQFRTSVAEANNFTTTILQRYASGNYKFPVLLRNFVVESAFLRIFIAWETFLENIFVKYMMGEQPVFTPIVNRYATPIDINHAKSFLIGLSGKQFVDWSTPDTIRKLSIIYFGNVNIINTVISSIHTDFLALKTIRNAAAHMTAATGGKLDVLASNIMGSPQVGIKAAMLLLWADPVPPIPVSLFSNYITLLDTSAELITNG
ncbi:hypothetical protein [uncultured Chitinophaga sp.]|uniref:hypothetical protein n=1 Tax=uncultured Chitinophaga sp. TaxID=339340 RepID=UPI0025EE9581|nr:hypothetical protein [uncultured Chitinophaga sp.]